MTLLEIMIVIFIIGIVGSVIGHNMLGSLDRGRAFKTEEASRKIYEIVLLQEACGSKIEGGKDHYQQTIRVLDESDLVRRPKDLMTDGWGGAFTPIYDEEKKEWHFTSAKYEAYCEKKGKTLRYPWSETEITDTDGNVVSPSH